MLPERIGESSVIFIGCLYISTSMMYHAAKVSSISVLHTSNFN